MASFGIGEAEGVSAAKTELGETGYDLGSLAFLMQGGEKTKIEGMLNGMSVDNARSLATMATNAHQLEKLGASGVADKLIAVVDQPAPAPGQPGQDGTNGDAGGAGHKGPRGGTGTKGDRGRKGQAGSNGAPSTLNGPVGLTGPKGEKGSRGNAGPPGA